uniref:2-dehydropantoate 2-reductase N-terminal domain-containing protein n=1 Tax=Sandarakinorhabdus sp. TaxID=1916663 RepID=UPI00286E5FC9
MNRIGVLGGGAWGTALAAAMASDAEVLLWAREQPVIDAINAAHENTLFLPGIALPGTVLATTALADLATCDVWLVVTPAQHL